MTRRTPRRGLVIGCGGVLGGAWSIAALDSVRHALDWDPREAEILVGTSAGAVLVALLGAGVSVDRLRRRRAVFDTALRTTARAVEAALRA